MEILEFKQANNIPEELLPSFHSSEVECWGSEPFSEYKICDDCRAIFSIEEVHGSVENFRNNSNCGDDFECLECGADTGYMYKTEEFLERLREYIKGDVTSVLLIDNNNIEGFGLLTVSTVEKIINSEIDARPDSYDKGVAIEYVYKNIESTDNNSVVYSNQIYVSPEYRKKDTSFKILKKLFNLNSEEFSGMPVVGETKFESKFYPISRLMGYIDVMTDKYGNVLQYGKDYNDVVQFFNEYKGFSDRKLIREMLSFRKYALNILEDKPSLTNRKFYI